MPIEYLFVGAAVVTIVSGLITIFKWLWDRSKAPSVEQAHTNIPLWDVTVATNEGEEESTVVARLTAAGETKEEAAYRAKELIEQWNNVSLGFELFSGKTIPNDDEGKPLTIVRSDLLPQFDNDSRPLSLALEKRERRPFPLARLFKHRIRRQRSDSDLQVGS